LLQAGAMQLPIICSRIAGNVDIVTHKQTGLIFDRSDETQLQQQISDALQNEATMKMMADKLHEIIQQDYRRENIWQNILDRYRSLIQKNNT
jgi:glycosyltransferase involved in cell wall biosynthesis